MEENDEVNQGAIIDNTKKKKRSVKIKEQPPKENLKPEEVNSIVENLRKSFLELDVINIDNSSEYEDKMNRYFQMQIKKEKMNKTMNLTEKDYENICDKLISVFNELNTKRKKEVYENMFSKKNIRSFIILDTLRNEMMMNNKEFTDYMNTDDIEDILGYDHKIVKMLNKIIDSIEKIIDEYKESD